jgi:hypothetical protein
LSVWVLTYSVVYSLFQWLAPLFYRGYPNSFFRSIGNSCQRFIQHQFFSLRRYNNFSKIKNSYFNDNKSIDQCRLIHFGFLDRSAFLVEIWALPQSTWRNSSLPSLARARYVIYKKKMFKYKYFSQSNHLFCNHTEVWLHKTLLLQNEIFWFLQIILYELKIENCFNFSVTVRGRGLQTS